MTFRYVLRHQSRSSALAHDLAFVLKGGGGGIVRRGVDGLVAFELDRADLHPLPVASVVFEAAAAVDLAPPLAEWIAEPWIAGRFDRPLGMRVVACTACVASAVELEPSPSSLWITTHAPGCADEDAGVALFRLVELTAAPLEDIGGGLRVYSRDGDGDGGDDADR